MSNSLLIFLFLSFFKEGILKSINSKHFYEIQEFQTLMDILNDCLISITFFEEFQLNQISSHTHTYQLSKYTLSTNEIKERNAT
jgi:hypothetical protein